MEQNKFEKETQQKLDELKIPPSEAVWQNVEKRIAIKKTRRRGVLVLFFIALFLLTGGYWWLHTDKVNQAPKQETLLQKEFVQAIKDSSSAHDKHVKKNSSVNPSAQKINSIVSPTISRQTGEKPKSRKTVFSKNGNLKNNIVDASAAENQPLNSADEKVEKLQNDLSRETGEIAIQKNNKTVNDDSNDLKNDVALTDRIIRPDAVAISVEKKDTSSVSKAETNTVSIHKRKWRPGITLSGGASLIGNEFLSGGNNLYSDYLSSMPGTGSGTGNSSYFYSSAVRSSFAFFAGFFIEKNISANHRISVGINYKYFSTLNRVGYKIDSAQIAYNFSTATTVSGDHRNSFSYLDLPVTITFRIGNAKTFPLFWHAGINVSELIYSNALQFKSVPGIYYIDNSFFNKTQFGFSTGFATTLFSDRKASLQIGPYFYYSASRLADKGMYNKKHFSYAGISTQLLFNKK